MATEPRSQSQSRPKTAPAGTPSTRLRTARRQRAESFTDATPTTIQLGPEASRFEAGLVMIAMAAIWVCFIATIVAL